MNPSIERPPPGLITVMWADPRTRWIVFAAALLGVVADASQVISLIPGS